MTNNTVHLQHDLHGFGSRLDAFLDGLRKDESAASGQHEAVPVTKRSARNMNTGVSGELPVLAPKQRPKVPTRP